MGYYSDDLFIEEQIELAKKTSERILKSKGATLEFFLKAGILMKKDLTKEDKKELAKLKK